MQEIDLNERREKQKQKKGMKDAQGRTRMPDSEGEGHAEARSGRAALAPLPSDTVVGPGPLDTQK